MLFPIDVQLATFSVHIVSIVPTNIHLYDYIFLTLNIFWYLRFQALGNTSSRVLKYIKVITEHNLGNFKRGGLEGAVC